MKPILVELASWVSLSGACIAVYIAESALFPSLNGAPVASLMLGSGCLKWWANSAAKPKGE